MESGRQLRKKTEVRRALESARQALSPRCELAFLLQDWEDGYNVGGLFRVADAVGAKELVMTGRTPVPPNPLIGVTSLGHHRRVPYRQFARHEDAARALRDEGWSLVMVELSEGAVPYQEFKYPPKTCLVLGNEEKGLYNCAARYRDGSVFVPMLGKGRSMNVHVAGAVVAYRALLG